MRIGVTCVMLRSTADNITTWQNIITGTGIQQPTWSPASTVLLPTLPGTTNASSGSVTIKQIHRAIHVSFVSVVASRMRPDLVQTVIFQARRCVVVTSESSRHRGKNCHGLKTNRVAPSPGPSVARPGDMRWGRAGHKAAMSMSAETCQIEM